MELDEDAFGQLHRQFYRQLCYYTEQITGNSPIAEDIASDSFIKLLQKRHSFSSLAKLKSFLFTVAHNAALDYLKAEKRHQSSHELISRTADTAEPPQELHRIRAEVLNAVFQEIEALPSQCREVIRLSFIEGLSVSEIADRMNIAYKTVLNQKTRGLGLLRTALVRKSVHPLLLAICVPFLFGK